MILHVILLILLFFFVVRDQVLAPFLDKLDVDLISVPKPLQPKMLIKPPKPQMRQVQVHEAEKTPVTRVAPIPNAEFQEQLTTKVPVDTTQPNLKQVEKVPTVKTDISTAFQDLTTRDSQLSPAETADLTGERAFGGKTVGVQGVRRTPTRSTLGFSETGTDTEPTQIGDLQEKGPGLDIIPLDRILRSLASKIVGTSEGGPIDVVFVVDNSGSMGDNIRAVSKHLREMVDVYENTEIDYALGLTQFWTNEGENIIQLIPLTKDLRQYRRDIEEMSTYRDENALDAIIKTVREFEFRATSKKHFILVTDEPFTSLVGVTLEDAIALCREFGVYVNVLGLEDDEHKLLAKETGGSWHVIPGLAKKMLRPQVQRPNTPQNLPRQNQTRNLRKAQWATVSKIGEALLQTVGNTPVDIVLFIDSSKSMEDKIPHFLSQLDILVRDWDNALIDYQLGVVRFRARGAVNIVNTFNPPQTLEEVKKIAELPCEKDENVSEALIEGLQRIKLRSGARPYLILITDEPVRDKASALAAIRYLKQKKAILSVIGTYDDFQERVAIETGGIWLPIPEGHTTNGTQW